MSDEYTNEDFLNALREVQESQKRPGPVGLDEWRQENLGKSRNVGHQAPGFGLMGSASLGHSLNTSSRGPRGPKSQQGFITERGPSNSKYDNMRQEQPKPWIDDVNMANVWYSPMDPVWPFGPPYYNVPREWNFPVGHNLNYINQRTELMAMLRGMRQSWGILSTVIETRKDQLLRLPWTIQVRNKPRANNKQVNEVRQFLRRPDGKLSYSQWTRKLLDDLFVIDAPTLYLERDLGGHLRNAQVLDGATIFPLIDDVGRRPDSEVTVNEDGVTYTKRQPAYQQIIYSLPMVNLSEDEIIYAMMRPRPEMPIFGYSQVEQVLTEASEAIRKTFYQLEFWRAGSMPELIVTVPDNWTPRQIAAFQAHFDAVLSGQLTLKSKVRFVPGGMKPFDIKNASGESLWSQRDELLVRLVCYAFSVSPTPFVKQTNRATANQAQESAQEEGLYPLMSYWKDDIMDTIIQEKFGYDDIEFTYLPRPEADQTKQSTIHQVRLHDGAMTINEVREEMGLEPIADGNYHLLYTGASVVRLDSVISGEALMPGTPAPTEPPKAAEPKSETATPVRGPARARNASPIPPKPSGASAPKPSATPTPVHKLDRGDIDRIADMADRNPSKRKRKIGNYTKGHLTLRGLGISIENARGSKRHGDAKMPTAYGYIKSTLGADGMQVDVFLGKHPDSLKVFVIDQDRCDEKGRDLGFDEHKVMLCYKDVSKAIKDYVRSYDSDKGHEKIAAITSLSYDELKDWLKSGDMKKPIAEQGIGHVVARRGIGGGISKADTVSQASGLLWHDQTGAKRKKRKKKKAKGNSIGPRWLSLAVA